MKKILMGILILSCFTSTVKAEVLKIPLHKISPIGTVDLKCVTAEYSITIPIPERWEVKKASISFKYVNSSGLLAGKSRMVIKLNKFPLAQIKLNPLATEGAVDMPIPALLLKPGYNELIFSVSQHYTMECENPCAEDLWTTLKLDEGFLEIEYDPKPVPLKLSTISNFLFDPKTFPYGEVNIVIENFSSEAVTVASIAASGIARRFDYKKVLFTVSEDIKPGYDNILVGRKEFVKKFLGQRDVEIDTEKIIGPYLKIMHMPAEEIKKDEEETDIYMRAKGNVVNVREKPLLTADVVVTLKQGDKIEKLKQEGDWIYADTGKGAKGWIHNNLLEEVEIVEEEKDTIEKDPTHVLVVVSGVDFDHVKLAAETMSIMSLPYPDTSELIAMEFTVPDIALYGGRLVLTPDKKYDFKTLNVGSQTFKGINPTPKDITFRLPADFLIKENEYAELILHFSYGAGMRSDSALNILLNDKAVRAIHLDNPDGDLIEGYRLTIPTHLFKPGTNTIKIKPVMTPSVTKNCEYMQTENLFFTVFQNSSLYIPPMPHFVKLPKIELFILNGFPFTRWPDAHEAMVYITNSDPDVIASAFNVIGLITQKNGYPLLALKISFENPVDWTGELIIIGDVNTIPESYKEITPLKLTKTTVVPYPVVRSWKGEASMAFSKQVSEISANRGFMMEFQSPFVEGRTILLITAHSTKDLLVLSEALIEPVVQGAIKGDVVMIDLTPPDYNVSALDIGQKYFTGKSGKVSKLDFYLQSYPYIYQLALGFIILFITSIGFYFLMRHRKRRKKIAREAESEDS